MRSRIPRETVMVFVSAMALTGLGLLALGQLQPSISLSGSEFLKQNFTKQLFYWGVGLAAMLVVLVPPYLSLRRFSYVLYGLCLLSLVAVMVLGQKHKGAASWFAVGPFSLQPSEFMKLGLVLVLSRFMMYQNNIEAIRGLMGPFLLTAVPLVLVLKQPDLGTAMIFFPMLLLMVYAAGARRSHLIAVLIVSAIFVPLAYKIVLKPHQKERLSAWAMLMVNPDEAPKDQVYQQTQSIRSIASGGVFGAGVGENPVLAPVQVPERQTDFIFTVIAENMGFFGSNLVLLFFALFFYNALRIAYNTREPFGRLIVVGCVTFLAAQMVINLAVCVGLAPVTGLTLPFMSYGGSSLLTSYLAVGLILNVGLRWVPSLAGRDFRDVNEPIRMFGGYKQQR